jgi:hypothetical protein
LRRGFFCRRDSGLGGLTHCRWLRNGCWSGLRDCWCRPRNGCRDGSSGPELLRLWRRRRHLNRTTAIRTADLFPRQTVVDIALPRADAANTDGHDERSRVTDGNI